MIDVSQRFLDECKSRSQTVISKLEIYKPSAPNDIVTVYPMEGFVNKDRTASNRQRLTGNFADEDGTLTPDDASDLLMPFGTRMRAYRGFRFYDNTEEYALLGTFELIDVEVTQSEGLQLRIDARDLSESISRAGVTTSFHAAAQKATGTIRKLISSVNEDLILDFDDFAWNAPVLDLDVGSDKWKAAQDLAVNLGADLWFSRDGTTVYLKPTPDPTETPAAWSFEEGTDGTMLSMQRHISNQDVANWWVVTGEHSGLDRPVRGEAFDNNPVSPTYIFGDYGVKVKHQQSTLVTGTGQAQAAADGYLRRSMGQAESLNFPVIVNPALEEGDCVSATTSKSKVSGVHMLDSLAIPLRADAALTCVGRKTVDDV